MLGMTSVTFRKYSIPEVVRLTAQAGLDGIEWGSDVHVLPGDRELAVHTAKLTRDAGLRVLSYGSYYRLCQSENPGMAFRPYLNTAVWLGAPVIRVWPGTMSPKQAEETGGDYLSRAAEELRLLCRMAAPKGISVSTEFHPGSLTETPQGAIRLLRQAGMGQTYWQCDPDQPFVWNAEALREIMPFLSNVHVFYWRDGERRLLSEGWGDWVEYLRMIGHGSCQERNFILEFARGDEPDAFLQDAAALRKLFSRE